MDYRLFIEIQSDKRFGKPCIIGTRISVFDVHSGLAKGISKEQIVADFPELTTPMIHACLAFAANKEHSLRIAS
ncbi:MAG: DUF433 domain-containing protein [Flavobacteriales bacterium]